MVYSHIGRIKEIHISREKTFKNKYNCIFYLDALIRYYVEEQKKPCVYDQV